MGNLLERIHTAVKLRRGQCEWCNKPLRDDATARHCSDDCKAEQWQASQH